MSMASAADKRLNNRPELIIVAGIVIIIVAGIVKCAARPERQEMET
jgi:hypothetical protein